MSRRSGWTAGKIVALILAVILGAGIVLGIVYRKEVAVMWGDLMRYFKRVEEEVPDDEDEGNTDGDAGDNTATAEKYDNMSVAEIEQNGLSLSMTPMLESDLSANAESGIAIMATVLPADATDKTLDWSVEIVDETSEWAQGKNVTDYVTVTSTDVGANVECLQPFGAQLQIKATSVSNPDVYATCTLDYYARVTGAKIKFATTSELTWGGGSTVSMGTVGVVGATSSAETNAYITEDMNKPFISFEFETSACTIALNEEDATITSSCAITQEFLTYMQDNGFQAKIMAVPEVTPISDVGININLKYFGLSWYAINGYVDAMPYEDYSAYIEARGNAYLNIANSYSGPVAVFNVNYKDSYSEKSFYISFSYQSDYFAVSVESVEFDQEGVVM